MTIKRADRVADMLREEISDILRREVNDPRIANITITDVRLSDDLRQAKVYFVQMGQDTEEPLLQEHLQRASGYVKRELGKRLHLRFIPQMHFFYDGSFEYGSRIDRLIADVKKGEDRDHEQGD